MFARTFAVLALAVAASPVVADEAEDRAVAVIERAGGRVVRDESQPGKPVVSVFLSGKTITDEEVKILAAFKELRRLEINDCPKLTDAGIKELSGLGKLTELRMTEFNKITDVGLSALQQLKDVDFYHARFVSEKGLQQLKRLEKLSFGCCDALGGPGVEKALPNVKVVRYR